MKIEENKQLLLSLGSNLGNKEENLKKAIQILAAVFYSEIRISSFYETEPWGFYATENFINCCVEIHTNLSPFEILTKTQQVEKEIGRLKKTENGNYKSRIIDVDILYYGNLILHSEKLVIPHPHIYQRDFVLFPLAEICPNFIDPQKNRTILELKRALND